MDAADDAVVSGLEPRPFWAHFEALTRIARPSRGEQPAIDHVTAWAGRRGLTVTQDAAGNVVVRVPATAGREAAPVVTLQAHLDMVCERDPGSPNDAAAGRIRLVRDGEWVGADGTTLGADDGAGIAAMLALADDPAAPHGRLELLMTVAEEVGMEGARALDRASITGSVLLNLDAEEDDNLTVGCAGSTDTWIRAAAPRAAVGAGAEWLAVTVSGGRGGHSGLDIALGRANAIKVLGRVLATASAAVPFRLGSLAGGTSRNAIPRDARAVCAVAAGAAAAFRDAIGEAAAAARAPFAGTDPAVTAAVSAADAAPDAWTEDATRRLLDLLAVIPVGPIALSADFPGVVETSTSIGEARTDAGTLTLRSLSRSSNDAALAAVLEALAAAARLSGAGFEATRNYGGWQPNLASPALAAATRVYERLFGAPPAVTTMHAGLEPAIIGARVPGLDMLAIGPRIEAPHSPGERISVPSVERFWQLLAGLLDELSVPGG